MEKFNAALHKNPDLLSDKSTCEHKRVESEEITEDSSDYDEIDMPC